MPFIYCLSQAIAHRTHKTHTRKTQTVQEEEETDLN